nr:hypothetical protein [Amycolatopsis rubida]
MADYYNVPIPEDAQVTRKSTGSAGSKIGIDKGLVASRDTGRSSELVEVFETRLRPVRLLNDVVDHISRETSGVDLTLNPDASVVHREPIIVEGVISPSPATKAAEYLEPMIPQLMEQAAAGATEMKLDQARFISSFSRNERSSNPKAYLIDPADRIEKFVVILRSDNLVGEEVSLEDILGEMTVFGLVEKVVRERSMISLEKYLLPGMNRSLRRLLPDPVIADMLEKLSDTLKEDIDPEDLHVPGPAYVIDVAAIFA